MAHRERSSAMTPGSESRGVCVLRWVIAWVLRWGEVRLAGSRSTGLRGGWTVRAPSWAGRSPMVRQFDEFLRKNVHRSPAAQQQTIMLLPTSLLPTALLPTALLPTALLPTALLP